MTDYAYVRVSTVDQKTDAQHDWLDRQGIPPANRFVDHGEDGDLLSRPALDRLLATVQPGDWIVAYRQDRLGRNATNTLTILSTIHARGVGFRDSAGISLPPPDDTDELGFARIDAEFRAGIQAVLDQREKRHLLAKTLAGIRSAQRKGIHCGRRAALDADDLKEAALMRQRESQAYVARRFGVTTRTLRDSLKKFYAANPAFDAALAVRGQRGRPMRPAIAPPVLPPKVEPRQVDLEEAIYEARAGRAA